MPSDYQDWNDIIYNLSDLIANKELRARIEKVCKRPEYSQNL